MIKRLYVHNFRCLENFELPISGLPSALLIGKNGVGKSSVGFALELLQRIARGTNRVRELIGVGDFSYERSDLPMRIQLKLSWKVAHLHITWRSNFRLGSKRYELLRSD